MSCLQILSNLLGGLVDRLPGGLTSLEGDAIGAVADFEMKRHFKMPAYLKVKVKSLKSGGAQLTVTYMRAPAVVSSSN